MKTKTLHLLIVLSLCLSILHFTGPAQPVLADTGAPITLHSTLVRTTVFQQLTSLPADVNTYQYALPVLSHNGNRIAFNRLDTGGANVINFDGSGMTEVDTLSGDLDISADGAKVTVSNRYELHIINADGSGKLTLILLDGTALGETCISGDGTTVYFMINGDTTYGGATPIQRGLWTINADGSDLRQVVSPEQVAVIMGVTAADVNPFWSYGESYLDTSNDGTRVVFSVSRNVSGHDYLFAVENSGANLHTVGTGDAAINRNVAISGDGSKVAYEVNQINPGPWELSVFNFDGSGKTALAGDEKYIVFSSYGGLWFTFDGSKLLDGGSGYVFNTDGSSVWQLAPNVLGAADWTLVHGATDYGSMSYDGTRFAYVYFDTGRLYQLASAEITDTLGQAPDITNPSISPANILYSVANNVTMQAQVSAPAGSIITQVAGAIMIYNGIQNKLTDIKMDNTSGSTYSFNSWTTPSQWLSTKGRQVVRIVAESTLSGTRHATQIEFEPFAIVDQLPGETYTVSGQAVDSSGSALAGVVISTQDGATATTQSDGSYTLTDLITGTHTLNAALVGYTFSSAVISVPPDITGQNFTGYALTPPTGLEALAGVASIRLEWVPSLNPAVTSYNVYRSTSASGSFTKVTPIPVTGDTWTDGDPALVKGTTYYYYLTSLAGTDESTPSNTASAQLGTVTLSIPDVNGPQGQSGTAPVNIENANGMAICAMDVFVSYTPATLVISDVQRTILTLQYGFAKNVVEPGVAKISLATAECGMPLYGPGTLFDLVFTVPGAAGAVSPLDFDVLRTDLYVNDDFYNQVPLSLDNGSFTVQTGYVLGDLNGDGNVTSADAAIALNIAVEKSPYHPPTPQQAVAGDVNGDRRINSADAALIMRIAAGLPLLPPPAANFDMLQALASVNMTVSNQEAGRGRSLSLPVQISSATAVAGAELIVNFEPSAFSVTGVRTTALTSNFNVQWNLPSAGVLRISLSPKPGYENGLNSGSGDFVNIDFAVNSTAPLGSQSPVTLATVRLSDAYSRNFETSALQTDIAVQNGVMTIVTASSWMSFLPVISRQG